MSRETAAPPNPAAPAAQEGERSGSRLRAMLDDVGALRNPLYRRFWFGSLGAVAGTQFVILATGWLVVDGLGGSPLDLGYVGAATAVPTIAVNLFGGVLADRMDRRMLLIVTSIISALLIGVLAVLDATGSVAIWHVVAISAALGLVYGVDWPVRNAFFPQLIDEEHMISAVALNSVVWQGTRIVSPAIAGIAIAVFGTAFVFAAATIGFVVMLVVLLALHVERAVTRQRRAVARDAVRGRRVHRAGAAVRGADAADVHDDVLRDVVHLPDAADGGRARDWADGLRLHALGDRGGRGERGPCSRSASSTSPDWGR